MKNTLKTLSLLTPLVCLVIAIIGCGEDTSLNQDNSFNSTENTSPMTILLATPGGQCGACPVGTKSDMCRYGADGETCLGFCYKIVEDGKPGGAKTVKTNNCDGTPIKKSQTNNDDIY